MSVTAPDIGAGSGSSRSLSILLWRVSTELSTTVPDPYVQSVLAFAPADASLPLAYAGEAT